MAQLVSGADWGLFTRLARRHKLTPIVSEVLSRNECGVPPEVVRDFGARHAVVAAYNELMARELVKVLSLLDEHRITAVSWKGPSLAALAYGKLTLRQFHDLDLLLDRDSMPRADKVLQSRGYRRRSPSDVNGDSFAARAGHDFSYDIHATRCVLEIGSRVAREPLLFGPSFDRLRDSVVHVHLAGRRVPTLRPEPLLICLCAHGAKHMWSRLQWVCDIASLMRSPDGLCDGTALAATAAAYRARRVTLLGMTLAETVTGVPVPDEFASTKAEREAVAALVRQCRPSLFARSPYPTPPLKAARFRWRAHDRSYDAIRYAALLLFRPTAAEWEALPLPRWARFLYYAIRPLRLAVNTLLTIARSRSRNTRDIANTAHLSEIPRPCGVGSRLSKCYSGVSFFCGKISEFAL